MTATEYAKGYAATLEVIELLSGTMTPDQMKVIAFQNITPVHVRDEDHYRGGCSDAWTDWQRKNK